MSLIYLYVISMYCVGKPILIIKGINKLYILVWIWEVRGSEATTSVSLFFVFPEQQPRLISAASDMFPALPTHQAPRNRGRDQDRHQAVSLIWSYRPCLVLVITSVTWADDLREREREKATLWPSCFAPGGRKQEAFTKWMNKRARCSCPKHTAP